jgi:hypothetical protein
MISVYETILYLVISSAYFGMGCGGRDGAITENLGNTEGQL